MVLQSSKLHPVSQDSSSNIVHNSFGRIEPDACGCGSDTGCDDSYEYDTESGFLPGPDSSNDTTDALDLRAPKGNARSWISDSNATVASSDEEPEILLPDRKTMFDWARCYTWFLLVGFHYSTVCATVDVIRMPFTLVFLQLLVGVVPAVILMLTRMIPWPTVSRRQLIQYLPLVASNVLTLVCMAHVSADKAQVFYMAEAIGALQPAATCVFAHLKSKETYNRSVYLSILPLLIGMLYAVFHFISFSSLAFVLSLVSMISSVFLFVGCKEELKKPSHPSINSSSLYVIIMVMSSLFLLPVSVLVELRSGIKMWQVRAVFMHHSPVRLCIWVCLGGVCHFFYNIISFMSLNTSSGSVPHSVLHTYINYTGKRFAVLSPFAFFLYLVPAREILGGFIAIFGVFIFNRYHRRFLKKERAKRRKRVELLQISGSEWNSS